MIASFVGFSVAALLLDGLDFKRNIYLLFNIPLVAALIIAFVISNDLNVKEINSHCFGKWVFLEQFYLVVCHCKNVLSQPSSERQKGFALIVTDILWPGLTYGLIDALLLSVLPILAVKLASAILLFLTVGLER